MSIRKSLLLFFKRFGILHILFWVLYSLFVYHGYVYNSDGNLFFAIKSTIVVVICNLMGIYFLMYQIIPKYYSNKKYIQLFFILIMVILCTAAISTGLKMLFVWKLNHPFFYYFLNFATSVIDSFLPYFLFLSIVIFNYAIKQQNTLHIKEKEFLHTEIQLLKSQMNPHLIFNALNSIYILMDGDKQKAQNVLMNFSDVLRFQLYESSEDSIELTAEIEFIKKYIELEKIRKNDELVVQATFEIHHPVKIAPLLLQPIIENAFKYVSSQVGEQWIHIDCKTTQTTFECKVENSIDKHTSASIHQGIGLMNLQRRLQLIYPNQHQLLIEKNNEQYSITLIILIK
jgi:two-component system, LytTR family, sensor kinase